MGQCTARSPCSPSAAPKRPSESPGGTPSSSHQVPAKVPSMAALEELFDTLADKSTGPSDEALGIAELSEVIEVLDRDYRWGLKPADAEKLLAFLRRSNPSSAPGVGPQGLAGVSRSQFVTGMAELAGVLHRVTGRLTVNQMKVVLAAAFDRFDLDNNGAISLEEFALAMSSLGFSAALADVACLHRFLAPEPPSGEDAPEIGQESLAGQPDAMERWNVALKTSLGRLRRKAGWESMVHCASRVHHVVAQPGSLPEKVHRALGAAWENIEDLADGSEFALDAAGLLVAARYVGEALQCVLQAQTVEGIDLLDEVPFALFLGTNAVSLAKELDELVLKEMDEREALLYAQLFHSHGFSQAQFRRLLGCPSCRWGSAEPGEVLSSSDGCLRLVVRGATELASPDAPPGARGLPLPAGTSIGETCFLRGRQLWTRERVVAAEPVLYVSWESEELRACLASDRSTELRMSCLLASTMEINLRALQTARARHGAGVGADRRPSLASSRQSLEELCGSAGLLPGHVGRAELQDLAAQVNCALGLGACEASHRRLLTYLGSDGEGAVDREQLRARLRALEDCLQSLDAVALSMRDLSTVMLRSSDYVDLDGDGIISLPEFSRILKLLQIPAEERQAQVLFSYFDVDNMGGIDVRRRGADAGSSLTLISALQNAVHTQVERKGLARFGYYAQKLQDLLHRPGDVSAKSHKLLTTAWDGIDSLFDAMSCSVDVAGAGVALCGIWQEVSGASGLQDIDGMNLAPLMIFLGMSCVHASRHLEEGQGSDLREHEALLYAQAFQDYGLSVGDFRRLLRYGKARWRHCRPGEALPAAGGRLQVVVRGSFDGEGPFLGRRLFERLCRPGGVAETAALSQRAPPAARAAEAVTLVTLDQRLLQANLERDDQLKLKVQRAAAFHMADQLLDADCSSCAVASVRSC